LSVPVSPRAAVLVGMFGAFASSLIACTNSSPSLHIVTVVPPTNTPVHLSNVQPIFDRSCSPGCHSGSSPAQGLNLESGKSWQSLVNVFSTEVGSLKRVWPGRSDRSYLVDKVEGSSIILGVRMPSGQLPLPPAEIQLIEDWINDGADNI